jgi:catechol 2,3-dioxygenase-like lactoylglutathione lyase family enzyme
MATVSVRYFVDDVDAAIRFYCQNLGFSEVMHPAPSFAMLAHGDLRLALSAPGGGPGGGAPARAVTGSPAIVPHHLWPITPAPAMVTVSRAKWRALSRDDGR